MQLNVPRTNGHTFNQWIFAILANTTLLTYGLQTGWISPMTKVLQSPETPTGEPLSKSELSWIASIMCLSAMFATPFYSFIADSYGRRIAVIAVAFLQTVSWIVKLLSTSTTHIIIARSICGIASGGCFSLVPMYVKEISQDSIRGLLGSLVILSQNIGLLFMYAIGYLDYYTVLWIVLVLSVITLPLMAKFPESPGYLVKTGRIDDATTTIAFLRGLGTSDKTVQNEISSLKCYDAYFKSVPPINFSVILKDKAYRKGFFLIIFIMMVQALNGNFAILTFAATILSDSGVTVTPELQTLSFPAVMMAGSLVSISCVEKFGRKPLFLTNLVIAAVSLSSLATTVLLQHHGASSSSTSSWVPVVAIISAVFAYAAGVAPIPFIVMSEILNFHIRSKVMGVVVSYAWFISFVQLACFEPVSSALGMHTTFYCFAAINFLGALGSLVWLPETKGKSSEQLEHEFRL